ncbi:uncharacterized protein LOC142922949 isoform X2 [Petromyzon marinus]|uniref:uncharacterized protein LOC142922949 isoform X2 n=1 Tax=Petromyzon marinus TaxID=7757 RepID=UPI003F71C5DE
MAQLGARINMEKASGGASGPPPGAGSAFAELLEPLTRAMEQLCAQGNVVKASGSASAPPPGAGSAFARQLELLAWPMAQLCAQICAQIEEVEAKVRARHAFWMGAADSRQPASR